MAHTLEGIICGVSLSEDLEKLLGRYNANKGFYL
jgi:hypothetical protein